MDKEDRDNGTDQAVESPLGEESTAAPEASDDKNLNPKPPSKIKILWKSYGPDLDVPTLMIMAKAAIPPTIALAFYQSDDVAAEYSTLGYLVAITSILGFCIMPRAKWVQTILLNLVGVCLGMCLALLGLWSSVQARIHTTRPGEPITGYNSSASAVCAVWLFFQIYLINALRSAFPQLQFPVICYAIFTNVAFSYGPQFPTTAVVISFCVTLIKSFLTGFALAAGTALFVFPVNARKPVFGEMAGYLGLLRGFLKAYTGYIQGFEQDDYFSDMKKTQTGAQGLKGATAALGALHAKLNGDLPFAKREVAFGKLGPDHITEIARKLRDVALPIFGLSATMEIFDKISEYQGWNKLGRSANNGNDAKDAARTEPQGEEAELQEARESFKQWQRIIKALSVSFAEIAGDMDLAMEHILLQLEFKPRPKPKKGDKTKSPDVESKGDEPPPGESGFADYFERRIEQFYHNRDHTLHQWCAAKGISMPADSFNTSVEWPIDQNTPQHIRDRRQLFIILYVEFLLHSCALALLALVRYAETKVEDGTMNRKRFIFPNRKRLKKWVKSVFTEQDDSTNEDHRAMNDGDTPFDVQLGEAWTTRKDPEHLPARNWFEHLGNGIRYIPRILRSEHSAFGFRAACATMSIAIVAYLKATQTFFIEQRLVWALIMVAFSMSRTAGQSLFSFVMRVFGTVIAMLASFIIWYIVVGHAAGVIVFMYIWIAGCFYVVLKKPKFVIVGILSAISTVLIVGYELQVNKIGVARSTTNGQPFYPVYELGPYRLATVAGGLFVAYLWTIFPYPVTEHTELRRSTGSGLYLLANYYSVVHESAAARTRGEYDVGFGPDDKNSPIKRLDKVRHKTFAKTQILLTQLRTQSAFSHWQIGLGGRFPQQTYDEIISSIERILKFTAIIGYATASFSENTGDERSEWKQDFFKLVNTVAPTSHDITSRLALLSASVHDGNPLPPYLTALEPFHLIKQLASVDRDILSIKHIAEPGYAAFAVLQIASRSIVEDLNRLTEHVKGLVGELDFSFHVVSTQSGSSRSSETLGTSQSRGSKSGKSD